MLLNLYEFDNDQQMIMCQELGFLKWSIKSFILNLHTLLQPCRGSDCSFHIEKRVVAERSWELDVGEDARSLLNNLHPYPEISKSQYEIIKSSWAYTAAPSCLMPGSSFSSPFSCCPSVVESYQTLYYWIIIIKIKTTLYYCSVLSWMVWQRMRRRKLKNCISLYFIHLTVSIRTVIEKVFVGIISEIDVDIILYWEALFSVHIKEYHSINSKHKKFLGEKFLFP